MRSGRAIAERYAGRRQKARPDPIVAIVAIVALRVLLVECVIQFVFQTFQLPSLEVCDRYVTSSLAGAHQRSEQQLDHRALAEGMRNNLGAPALFAESRSSKSVVRVTRWCDKVRLFRTLTPSMTTLSMKSHISQYVC